jgi:hypothetical protein
MPFKLVIPAARSSAMTGDRSAAVRLARAMRALLAMLGARWPKWRPVGVAPVCQSYVNSSQLLRRAQPTVCPTRDPPFRATKAARHVDRDPPRLVLRKHLRLARPNCSRRSSRSSSVGPPNWMREMTALRARPRSACASTRGSSPASMPTPSRWGSPASPGWPSRGAYCCWLRGSARTDRCN